MPSFKLIDLDIGFHETHSSVVQKSLQPTPVTWHKTSIQKRNRTPELRKVSSLDQDLRVHDADKSLSILGFVGVFPTVLFAMIVVMNN
jgi:hypothetical protein